MTREPVYVWEDQVTGQLLAFHHACKASFTASFTAGWWRYQRCAGVATKAPCGLDACPFTDRTEEESESTVTEQESESTVTHLENPPQVKASEFAKQVCVAANLMSSAGAFTVAAMDEHDREYMRGLMELITHTHGLDTGEVWEPLQSLILGLAQNEYKGESNLALFAEVFSFVVAATDAMTFGGIGDRVDGAGERLHGMVLLALQISNLPEPLCGAYRALVQALLEVSE